MAAATFRDGVAGGTSRFAGSRFDDLTERLDLFGLSDAVVDEIPETDAVLAARLLQTGESVAAATAVFASRTAADLAPLDVFADVAFAEVVV